jgi:glyoxylase-like metal-dependent hydrolase (beta-lactamase superfamily II)/Tol biopolymer transport system component
MKFVRWVLILGVMAGCGSQPPKSEEIPFRVNKLSDRVTIFAPGNFAIPTPTNVITTDQGLIVIDTGLTPTQAEATRRKIKQELGRDDVMTIINTHYHFDHTDGNQAYPEAEIIGHESVPAAMERFVQGKEEFIASRRNRISSLEGRLKTLDPESEEAKGLVETVRFNRMLIDDLLSGYVATPPTKTFADRMDLKVADLDLHLIYFGQAHTDGDILIQVPKLGLLYVGDLFHPDILGVTADPAAGPDVPRWLKVLGLVLENEGEVKTVIGGHGMVKDRAWLAAQFRYMHDLWEGVEKAKAERSNPEAVESNLPLQESFSYLSPYFDLGSADVISRHGENIRTFWRVGLKSASAEVEQVLRESGVKAARSRFKEIRTKLAHEYFVDEREFNALGYKYLRNERKGPEAVAVFEMNTEAFPQSWNVWDSLAEAYLWGIGDRQKAEEYYQKSLDLNPDNQSAKDNLSQIRGYKLDAEGQTKALSKFRPGQPTGIQSPYFGQTPPGLEPEVFAPGIVSLAGHFEFAITFGPDGKEIFFTRRKEPEGQNVIMGARWEEAGWTAPGEAVFAKGYPSNEPHITPDGRKLYFGSFRQAQGEERAEYGIWVTEKTNGGWSEAHKHGPGMFVSSSRGGDLFMTDVTNIAGGGIIRYPFRDGALGQPEKLGGGVNSPKPGAHAFIAPDESFIVFDSYQRPGGQGGEGDLWVCFLNEDGTWGEALNLGDNVNTPATNFCPSISPDRKYLFYSTCRDIYWVSAEVIYRLRPSR